MNERIDFENIFTPQGMLGHVSKHPNLDFLMNIFNIPRVYSVSGFGTWNVGQHTVAVAFLVLYWSAFNSYPQEKRDRLVTLALMHDVHEAVIGDILPFFKTAPVKEAIDNGSMCTLNCPEEVELADLLCELHPWAEMARFSRSGGRHGQAEDESRPDQHRSGPLRPVPPRTDPR